MFRHTGTRHEVSVSKSRSRDAVLECLGLVSVTGLNVSFYKLIFNDRSSLKLASVIG